MTPECAKWPWESGCPSLILRRRGGGDPKRKRSHLGGRAPPLEALARVGVEKGGWQFIFRTQKRKDERQPGRDVGSLGDGGWEGGG